MFKALILSRALSIMSDARKERTDLIKALSVASCASYEQGLADGVPNTPTRSGRSCKGAKKAADDSLFRRGEAARSRSCKRPDRRRHGRGRSAATQHSKKKNDQAKTPAGRDKPTKPTLLKRGHTRALDWSKYSKAKPRGSGVYRRSTSRSFRRSATNRMLDLIRASA